LILKLLVNGHNQSIPPPWDRLFGVPKRGICVPKLWEIRSGIASNNAEKETTWAQRRHAETVKEWIAVQSIF